jgi:hypothetical protein
MEKAKEEMQKIIDEAGMPYIRVIDQDTVAARVDDEWEVFHRSDELSGDPGSGLQHYGSVFGVPLMIRAIAADMQAVFKLLAN